MTDLEKARRLAGEAADKVLSESIDDDDFETRISEVKEQYETVANLDPNDLDAQFNTVFFMALGFKLVPAKHSEAMKILTGACKTALNQLAAADIPVEKKQKFLADFSLRMEKIISDFCWEDRSRTDLAILLGSLAFDKNPHASGWGISKFQVFQEQFDSVSEEIIERSLTFASEILVMLKQLDLENKYACTAHIAKAAVWEAIKAPAFAYNDEFYGRYEALLKQTILVAKTSTPHEVYYIHEPYYIGQMSDELKESYSNSKLKKLIMELNAEAKAEAISRYWETHPGEKERLEQEKTALEKELDARLAVKQEKSAAAKKAEGEASDERNRLLQPEEAKIRNTEAEIQSMAKKLASLGFFQGKQKKALRAEIDAKQLELGEAEICYEELKSAADAAFEEKTKEPNKQLEEARSSAKEIKEKLDAVRKELENPLSQK